MEQPLPAYTAIEYIKYLNIDKVNSTGHAVCVESSREVEHCILFESINFAV